MTRPTQIHGGKQDFRRHYLSEWLEERDMEPMDFVHAYNEAEPDHLIDKSQVYRWLKGSLPRDATKVRIAAVLQLNDPETGDPDPEMLMHHPAHDWIARKLRGRSKAEIERIKGVLDLSFPDKTGTDQ